MPLTPSQEGVGAPLRVSLTQANSRTQRQVPLSVQLRHLWGGFLRQFGWIFVGFGLCFFWPMGGNYLVRHNVFFSADLSDTTGSITQIEDINLSVNEEPIFAYHYRFNAQGQPLTGHNNSGYGMFAIGDPVSVEYAVGNAYHSRIHGLRPGLEVFFGLLFPGIRACFVLSALFRGLRGNALLKRGVLTDGQLVSKTATNSEVNEQTVYKFVFEFQSEHGESGIVTAKTHDVARFAGEGGALGTEPLLYSPANLRFAILLDDLPGGPRIDADGNIEGNLPAALLASILPGISLVGHGILIPHVMELL